MMHTHIHCIYTLAKWLTNGAEVKYHCKKQQYCSDINVKDNNIKKNKNQWEKDKKSMLAVCVSVFTGEI